MVFAFAPIVALLLGLVVDHGAVGHAADVGGALHRGAGDPRAAAGARPCSRRGRSAFDAALARIGPWSIAALLATLVLLFAFQGEAILEQPLVIAMLAVPILIQVFFNSGLAYWLNRRLGESHSVAVPVGADRRQQLLRAGGRRGDQPVRLRVGRGAGHRRRRADRGAGDAAGGARRQSQQGLVRGGAAPSRPEGSTDDVTSRSIHNPACGTSRNTLALIRHAGIEPTVVEYLKTPPVEGEAARARWPRWACRCASCCVRRARPTRSSGWTIRGWSDDQLLDAMLEHPILINRPIVETELGTKLCRPSEEVLELLPVPRLRASPRRTESSSTTRGDDVADGVRASQRMRR